LPVMEKKFKKFKTVEERNKHRDKHRAKKERG
jgi:hypothetical protein